MTKATCDFCGKKTEVQRTHYGSGFGYIRLICAECQKELNAEIIHPEKKIITFDDWVKDVLRIEPRQITHLSPEEQKNVSFTVSVDNLIKLWNAGVENGLMSKG